MSVRITGYTLLSLGLLLITVVSVNLYQVFTRQIPPLQFFTLPSISFQVPGQVAAPAIQLLSGQALSDMANLSVHLIFASFLVGVGYKISSLGVQLIRPIEVKLNSK